MNQNIGIISVSIILTKDLRFAVILNSSILYEYFTIILFLCWYFMYRSQEQLWLLLSFSFCYLKIKKKK